MSEATTELSAADAVIELQRQLEDVEDQIGAESLAWRKYAANPAAVEQSAARLSTLERQRELLRAALEQAQGTASALAADVERQRIERELDSRLRPLAMQWGTLGRELDEAARHLASMVAKVRAHFGPEVSEEVSALLMAGRGKLLSAMVGKVNLRHAIDCTIAKEVGAQVWPVDRLTDRDDLYRTRTIRGEFEAEAARLLEALDPASQD